MKLKNYIFILFTIMMVITACNNDETCRKNRIVKMSVYFYKDTININTGDTVAQTLTLDSITAYGLNVDSILYKKATGKSSIQLPLNQFAEESKFVLKCDTLYDTLTVKYTNQYYFLSLECGNIRVHHIDTVFSAGHFFQYATIENPEVNTTTTLSNAKNIKIHHFIK
ncbi:conserved exported hypothetical protein [uncultured Paludibacter sp.]|uniref:Lipoprotein n=1 Tax=uncultured Paludibacter sp. TaxID=497635 RepID=A0A653AKZ6_9BACT|nr:conserved exported hypothetical protein [uncultured Paludibacter sp.]